MTENRESVSYTYAPDTHFPDVTRVTVVGQDGLVFEKYDLFKGGVDLFLQDEGRTLKIFPKLEVEKYSA